MSVKTALATKVVKPAARIGRKVGYKISAKAPTILIISGIGAVFAAGVMIAKRSKKAAETIDEFATERQSLEDTIEHEAQIAATEEIKERGVTDEKEKNYILCKYRKRIRKAYGKALRRLYLKFIGKLLRIYALPALIGVLGAVMILGSHRIMLKRLAGVTALYKATDEAFTQYRQNVVNDLGEEADLKYRYGIQNYEFQGVETDSKGKEKTVTETRAIAGSGSPFEFKFCRDTSQEYTGDEVYDMSMLQIEQNNVISAVSDGKKVFLNDALKAIGMKPVYPLGQVAMFKPNGFKIRRVYEPIVKDGVHLAEGGKAKFDTVYYLDMDLTERWTIVEKDEPKTKKEA